MDLGKTFRWTLTGIAATVALVFVLALAVTRSAAFHHFLLGKIIQQAQESTGARVEVQKMDLRWNPLTADFYAVIVHGTESASEPALLKTDHLRVSLGIQELLRHRVDLYAIALDSPVLHLRVTTDGRNNLPHTSQPSNASPSKTSFLVRHAAIRDGLLNYNDEKIPLSADLENFYAQADFDPGTNMYTGLLGYQQGFIAAKDMNTFEHATQVNFAANSEGIILNRVALNSGTSRILAHAQLTDYQHPRIVGEYEGAIATAQLARILKNPQLPAGDVSLDGKFEYHDQSNQSFLLGLRVVGQIGSRALTLHTVQPAATLTSIHGDYEIRDANLIVSRLHASLFDGNLSGTFAVKHLDRAVSPSQLSARLDGVSLAKISDSLPSSTRKNARLIGRLNANLQANWSNSIQQLVAHSHAEVHAPL